MIDIKTAKVMLDNKRYIYTVLRYPDELQKLKKEYNKAKTEELFGKSKEALEWLKGKLQE